MTPVLNRADFTIVSAKLSSKRGCGYWPQIQQGVTGSFHFAHRLFDHVERSAFEAII